jgi:hypothetical protein
MSIVSTNAKCGIMNENVYAKVEGIWSHVAKFKQKECTNVCHLYIGSIKLLMLVYEHLEEITSPILWSVDYIHYGFQYLFIFKFQGFQMLWLMHTLKRMCVNGINNN